MVIKLDKIIKNIVITFLKIIHKDKQDSIITTLTQFIKFGIIGATNTAISYIINIVVLRLLQHYQLSWDYIAGNVIAFILSVLWSFYWNNKYVFAEGNEQTRNVWTTLLKTYISYGFTGILLTNILSYIWIDVLGISKYIAPLINLIISIPLNFIIIKLWAFQIHTEETKGIDQDQ